MASNNRRPQVREDLLSIYVASRVAILAYFILYAAFSVERDDGWGYQLYLLAWVLSLFAQFKSFVSVFWLAVTTGVFLQGIGVSLVQFFVVILLFFLTFLIPTQVRSQHLSLLLLLLDCCCCRPAVIIPWLQSFRRLVKSIDSFTYFVHIFCHTAACRTPVSPLHQHFPAFFYRSLS